MSSRQLAYAAKNGRRVTFTFVHGDHEHGYIVGMDDYHWLLAVVTDDAAEPVEVTLIHKGSASRIKITAQDSLSQESSEVQKAVRRIGSKFFEWAESFTAATSPSNN